MNSKETDNELSQWFSTYGLITSERILGKYNIRLPQSDLIASIKNPVSFYHFLLKAPLRNVLNGIILEQANDYYVYIQKLLIDYLLSGESSKDSESQGALTREAIESERQQLLVLGEQFQKIQLKQDHLIASSQAALISATQKFNKELENVILLLKNTLNGIDNKTIRNSMNHSLIYSNITELEDQNSIWFFIDKMNEILNLPLNNSTKEEMANSLYKIIKIILETKKQISGFVEEANGIAQEANSIRAQFYEAVIRVIDLIKVLPDYKIDLNQDIINRESLHFDNNIGSMND